MKYMLTWQLTRTLQKAVRGQSATGIRQNYRLKN